MSTPSNSHIVAAFKAVSRGASVAVILGGCLVLVGWIFDIQILTTPRPDWVTVKANTALAFVLAGIALWLLQEERTADGGGGSRTWAGRSSPCWACSS